MMASFIMSGRLQAIGFVLLMAALSIVLPPVMLFSMAAIGLVSLRLGWQHGVIVGMVGVLGFALAGLLMSSPFNTSLIVSAIQLLPLIFFSHILTRTVSWSKVMQLMIGISASGIVVFYMLVPDVKMFWDGIMTTLLQPAVDAKQMKADDLKQLVDTTAAWLAGGIGASLVIVWLLGMFMARHWQAMLYKPGGFGEEFRALRVGKVPAMLLLATIALFAMTNNELAGNLLIPAMMVFFFHALGLMHGLVRQMNMHVGWLVGMYVFIVLTFQLAIIILISFALIDSFADFRNKLGERS